MICPACGRSMLNMATFFKCSNGFCDYEEDIESWPEIADPTPAAAENQYEPAAA